jgi:hypothetical protein
MYAGRDSTNSEDPKRLKQSFLRSPDLLKVPLELKIMTMRRGTVLGPFD